MNEKITAKQVYILVFAIVVGIAFMETSGAMWTSQFWKEFLLNVIVYGVIVEFVIILINVFKK